MEQKKFASRLEVYFHLQTMQQDLYRRNASRLEEPTVATLSIFSFAKEPRGCNPTGEILCPDAVTGRADTSLTVSDIYAQVMMSRASAFGKDDQICSLWWNQKSVPLG